MSDQHGVTDWRGCFGSLDPGNGDVTSFVVGMFRPEKGQTLLVGNVRLSPDWPPPKVLGWYSPYNHDGYSAAVALCASEM